MTGKFVPVLTVLLLTGCVGVPLQRVAESTGKETRKSAGHTVEVDPDVVAAFPPGATIEIVCGPTDTIKGTVLHASADGVALLNCEQIHHNEGDGGAFHRHIPVHWTSIRLMVAAKVLSPPPEDYVAPRLEIDTDDRIVQVEGERIGVDFDLNVKAGVSSGEVIRVSESKDR